VRSVGSTPWPHEHGSPTGDAGASPKAGGPSTLAAMTRTDQRPSSEVERHGEPVDPLPRSEGLAAQIWKHRTTAAEPRGVRLVCTHRLAGAGTSPKRSSVRSALLRSPTRSQRLGGPTVTAPPIGHHGTSLPEVAMAAESDRRRATGCGQSSHRPACPKMRSSTKAGRLMRSWNTDQLDSVAPQPRGPC
jgi:hypothetical protein